MAVNRVKTLKVFFSFSLLLIDAGIIWNLYFWLIDGFDPLKDLKISFEIVHQYWSIINQHQLISKRSIKIPIIWNKLKCSHTFSDYLLTTDWDYLVSPLAIIIFIQINFLWKVLLFLSISWMFRYKAGIVRMVLE